MIVLAKFGILSSIGMGKQRKSRKLLKVVVAIDLYGACARRQFSGIIRHLEKTHGWNLRLVHTTEELSTVLSKDADPSRIDGAIVGPMRDEALFGLLSSSSVPLVTLNIPRERILPHKGALVSVHLDNRRIGETAAKHLLSTGNFRSFAYVPVRTKAIPQWSEERQQAFSETLKANRHAVKVIDPKRNLGEWLNALPKPAAVFAANDVTALKVLEAARDTGIDVPEQMSVLGVDDDELICNSSYPALTSIRPDNEQEGLLAARELDRLMRGRRRKSGNALLCPVKGISERESVKTPVPASTLIRHARDLIAENAAHGITPDEIALRLGISRRLLDLRFRKFESETPAQMILRMRLERIKSALTRTSLPISRLALMHGFGNANSLRNIFRRQFGMSPGDWRRRRHQVPSTS